jgi:ribonuclease Z
MIDVCLLGTGGMMPLPGRYLTSLMVRYNGKSILIDCGEGTQIALRKKGWSPNPIDVICFTHFHADHISGLPGMLLTMGNSDRQEPLTLIGPRGLTKTVNALRTIAPELPFPIEFIEIDGAEQDFELADMLHLKAFKVNHNVPCYGYTLSLDRLGQFDVNKAKSLGLEVTYWNKLQHGENVEVDGKVYTPDMVMGADRKGLKLTYTTDTRPCQSIIDNARDSDLFICEGMYGENENLDKAKKHKHMIFSEAANIAKEAGVKELWLTHYSPAMVKPQPFIPATQKIFANTVAGKDGMSTELKFEE